MERLSAGASPSSECIVVGPIVNDDEAENATVEHVLNPTLVHFMMKFVLDRSEHLCTVCLSALHVGVS